MVKTFSPFVRSSLYFLFQYYLNTSGPIERTVDIPLDLLALQKKHFWSKSFKIFKWKNIWYSLWNPSLWPSWLPVLPKKAFFRSHSSLPERKTFGLCSKDLFALDWTLVFLKKIAIVLPGKKFYWMWSTPTHRI